MLSLKKNAFTGVHYNFLYLCAATAVVLVLHVLPFALVYFLAEPGDYLLFACIFIIGILHLGRAALDDKVHWGFFGYPIGALLDRKSTRLNSSHSAKSRMPSSA